MLSRFFTRNEQFVLIALAGALSLGAITLHWVSTRTHPTQQNVASFHESSPNTPRTESAHLNVPAQLQNANALLQTSDTAAQTPPITGEQQSPLPYKPEKPKIRVAIMGWVTRPGAYEFAEGDRVDDAILRAGGLKEGADINDINLVAPLIDGSTLIIPRGPTASIAQGRLVVRGADTSNRLRNPPQYTVSGWRALSNPPAENSPEPHTSSTPDPLDLNSATLEQLVSLPTIGPVLAQRIIDARQTRPFSSVDDLRRVKGIGEKTLEKLKPFVTVK